MTIAAAAMLDVTVVLLAALAAVAALRRRSAALRHWILTAAVACALAAPALELTLPAWNLPIGASTWATTVVSPGTLAAFGSIVSIDSSAAPAVPGWNGLQIDRPGLTGVLLGVWAIGALIALSILTVRLVRLGRMARSAAGVDDPRWNQLLRAEARVHGICRAIDLLHSGDRAMVVTWGLVRPRVLVPANARGWTDARIRVVLSHELAHVRRNDWSVQLGADLLKSIYWFHPLAWTTARLLRREAERACDDLVLNTGIAGLDYADHLLAVARAATGPIAPAAAAMARFSTLEGRIRAMLNARLNRDPLTRRGRIAALLFIASVALPVSTMSTRPSAQSGLGSIAGTVYDPAGGVLPSVGLKVRNAEDGRTYDAATDRTGRFAIRDVPAGVYELTISLPGFATVKATVDVRPGERIQRSVVLPLGSIEETLTVVGGGPEAPDTPALRPAREIPPPRGPASMAGGIGGSIKAPTKVVDMKPRYPAELEGSGAAATVTLAGRIAIDGYVLDLKDVSVTAAHPAFVASALAAARQWEFSPTLLNGAPIETNMTITVRYRPQ
jgi:beta-lactamase regulating signal transducer with metallopeptidase domain